MKKAIAIGLFMILFVSFNISAMEIQLYVPLGVSAKSDIMFKQLYGERNTFYGAGAAVFFNKNWGAYIDTHIMNTDGESNYYRQKITYGETSVGLGLIYRFNIWEPSPNTRLNLFVKVGGQYIKYYEEFAEKISDSVFGFSLGLGAMFWMNQFGVGLELKREVAEKDIEIVGMSGDESISFNSTKISVNGAIRF